MGGMRLGRSMWGARRGIVTDLAALIAIALLPLLILGAYLSYRGVRE